MAGRLGRRGILLFLLPGTAVKLGGEPWGRGLLMMMLRRLLVLDMMLGEVAADFDRVHSVERAVEMGSVNAIIPSARLRPYLVDAVERGMRRTLEQRVEVDGAQVADSLRG